MKKILGAVLGMLLFVNPASAEIQTYDGEGVYIMSDFETPEIGKDRNKPASGLIHISKCKIIWSSKMKSLF